MRIALIAESYPPAVGGAEFALQKLAEGFVQKGHEVWVVTSSWQRHDAREERLGQLRITRVKTLPFFHRFWFILFSLPVVLRAARWADIVQGSTFAGGPPAFLGGWLAGKKKILIVHEVWGKRWREFESSVLRALFYRMTEWIIVRLPFDHYVGVSSYTKRSLVGMGVCEDRVTAIHHGDSKLDLPDVPRENIRKDLGFSTEDFVFLSYGRVGISKGFEYLTEAVPDVIRRLPHARFVLVLSGYDARIMRRIHKAIENVPSDRCLLLPSQPRAELARYLAAADGVVIPSLSEGFGFSALEACLAGKTLVCTEAGSLPEVVFGKYILVKPGSVPDLAEGCTLAAIGNIQVSPPKEFHWHKAVFCYLQVYQSQLSH